MKKLNFLWLLLFALPVHGQVIVGNYSIQYVYTAPSGSCSQNAPMRLVIPQGHLYACQSGTWADITGGGGGGGGTVTSFSAGTLSPLFTTSVATSTTTPALTFSLTNAAANTAFGNFTGSSAAPSYTVTTGTGSPVAATSPSIASPTITSSFTATGLVTLADLATQATNTALVNATSGTASPTAQTVPSCSAASNALIWTTNTGFGCNTSITANSATTATSATTAVNLSGGSTVTGTPAASVAAIQTNATLFTGGNGTTTFPYLMLQPSGATAETGWSTAGTMIGGNAASGFAGNFLDFHTNNGAAVFSVSATGSATLAGGSLNISANGNGVIGAGILAIRAGSGQPLNLGGNNATQWVMASAGGLSGAGNFSAGSYSTATNCAGVGTAASPSVVSCTSAAAGAFSCDVAASAATCTVNTTGVTANSEIFVQEVADESTRLGVTCNTAPTVSPAILVATKTAATGFTINMPTITVNPACFVYRILN